jgi:hypothetical protein
MRNSRENPVAVAGRCRAPNFVTAGGLDVSDNTSLCRIFRPTARAPAFPVGLPVDGLIARHFFGALDFATSMEVAE